MTKRSKTINSDSLESFITTTPNPSDEIRLASIQWAKSALKTADLCVQHSSHIQPEMKPILGQQLLVISEIIENLHREPHQEEADAAR